MHGCRRLWLPLLGLLLCGCGDEVAPDAPVTATTPQGLSTFNPAHTGSIGGCVIWEGEIPHIPDLPVHAYLDYLNADRLRGPQSNPHAPRIDAKSRGVAGAVIFLRQVKSESARPWPHAPVRVVTETDQLSIFQGEERRPIGFVHRGAEVEFVSRDPQYHILRIRGATFFTMPFVTPGQAARRNLADTGIVEITEGAGLYWRRGYLFVLDHPYAALTDCHGNFVLDQVPSGPCELCVWLPNWQIVKRDRDPETAAVRRLEFAPPLELSQSVTVRPGETVQATLKLSRRGRL